MSSETTLRRTLIDVACEVNKRGLNQGTSGNISLRLDRDWLLITPSAQAYEECTPEDMVKVSMSGEAVGARKPSSEWRMHRDIFKAYPEAGCVVHTHSIWSTVLACLEREIPPFHYMVAVAGGDTVPCAPYATFGTEELSELMLSTIKGRRACLLAHHGLICFDKSPEKTLALAAEVETLAKMYVQVLQVEKPKLLSEKEMGEVLSRFAAYKP